jgi:hypothetical protein
MVETTRSLRRPGVGALFLVCLLLLAGCSRIVSAGGSVGGAVPPSLDGVGGQPRVGPPIGERLGQRGAADGVVKGLISAEEGSPHTSVRVELFELPARVLHSVQAWVDEEYSIGYASDFVNCRELAVRFVLPGGATPRIKHLGGCGTHVVNHEIPVDD